MDHDHDNARALNGHGRPDAGLAALTEEIMASLDAELAALEIEQAMLDKRLLKIRAAMGEIVASSKQ